MLVLRERSTLQFTLNNAAEIKLWNLIKQFNYRLKWKLDIGDSWLMGIFGLLPGCPI